MFSLILLVFAFVCFALSTVWLDEEHIAEMAVEGACVALGGMLVGPLFKTLR